MKNEQNKAIPVLTFAVWNGTIPFSWFQAAEEAGSMQGVAGVTGDIGRGPQLVTTNRLVDSSIGDIDIWTDYLWKKTIAGRRSL